jgi:hypothetical protein
VRYQWQPRKAGDGLEPYDDWGASLLQYGLFGVGVKARRAGGQLLLPSVAARGGVVRSEGLS